MTEMRTVWVSCPTAPNGHKESEPCIGVGRLGSSMSHCLPGGLWAAHQGFLNFNFLVVSTDSNSLRTGLWDT